MRIAVDALGGDHAPAQTVLGGVMAARKRPDVQILLVGEPVAIEQELAKANGGLTNLTIVAAPETIEMHESPVEALRRKPNSSIAVGIGLVRKQMADAFVSAGNTGAVVAASYLGMRNLKGVLRPGIAVPMRGFAGTCVGIDMGANIAAKPRHLYQYGIMASVFAQYVLGFEKPRVGLVNIGEEASKGTPLVRQAYKLLSKSHLNFVGNVEGKDILTGGCDVFVCDGFVGNVMLKMAEGIVMAAAAKLRDLAGDDPWAELGFCLSHRSFEKLRHMGDYAEFGGAPLLGVDGVTIISHGRSDARAIENAVHEAVRFVQLDVNSIIREAVASGGLS